MDEINRILSEFNAVGLEDISEAKLMDRIDTKFAFKLVDLVSILSELKKDFFVLDINGKRMGAYESLYFDNDTFQFYHDHHNAKIHRFKVRFRKYVDSELYFLEVKEKIKGRVSKRRIAVSRFDLELTPEEKEFIAIAIGADKELKPQLWNNYKRITLVSADKKDRLTLDLDLSFSWDGQEKRFEDIVIAELKQENLNRNSPFFKLMRNLGIRPYRLSKYCIGTIELHAKRKIKYNRFKQKLLKLKGLQNDT
jgi:hypothetical protein